MTGLNISVLKGKTLCAVERSANNDELRFETRDGESYKLYHSQDCCESVYIESIVGDLADLVGSPLLQAEEVSDEWAGPPDHSYVESYTWTFYKLATINGSVTVRFLGESNGYYSESVDFVRTSEVRE